MQELVNYRCDRTSGRNAIPWMLTAIGARQDAEITGICVSKQYWKLQLRKSHDEPVTYTGEDGSEQQMLEADPDTGETRPATRPVMVPDVDRPDVTLFPPECVMIDPAADWTNPAQSAATNSVGARYSTSEAGPGGPNRLTTSPPASSASWTRSPLTNAT